MQPNDNDATTEQNVIVNWQNNGNPWFYEQVCIFQEILLYQIPVDIYVITNP